MQEPKARKDMDPRYLWDLSSIIESAAELERQFKEAQEQVSAFSTWQGHVGENPRKAIREAMEMNRLLERLLVYAAMYADQDGGDSQAQDQLTRARSLAAKAESAVSFLQPELLSLPEQTLLDMKNDPDFSEYDVFVDDLLRNKPHTLSAKEERLLAMTNELMGAPDAVYTMLSDVDMPFPVVKDEEGNQVKLSNAMYGRLIRSRNREVRRGAFEAMMKGYNDYRQTYAATYRYSVKGDVVVARARNFDSAIEASLFPDRIPVAVYDNLLSGIEAMRPAMKKYMELRKKKLGVDEVHLYDLYVSIVDDFDMKLTYPEAFQVVKKGLAPLGEHYAQLLDEAYNNHWIDVYENRGKRSGAYSSGSSRPHPYVLLNQKDNLESMFTIAHEMGHALHSYYSCHNQPVNTSDYVIFVAEVASTCNEVLLMRYLLSRTQDKKERAYLINNFLDQFKGTVYRQTMFAEFELEMGRMSEAGQALTADVLCEKYKALNELYYGPDMVCDEGIALEWARIPHFFYDYYVFQYATGFSAAVAIAERILTEGAPAVADYKRFLSGGSSTDPISLLKIAGVDMSRPESIDSALALFGELIDELDKLS